MLLFCVQSFVIFVSFLDDDDDDDDNQSVHTFFKNHYIIMCFDSEKMRSVATTSVPSKKESKQALINFTNNEYNQPMRSLTTDMQWHIKENCIILKECTTVLLCKLILRIKTRYYVYFLGCKVLPRERYKTVFSLLSVIHLSISLLFEYFEFRKSISKTHRDFSVFCERDSTRKPCMLQLEFMYKFGNCRQKDKASEAAPEKYSANDLSRAYLFLSIFCITYYNITYTHSISKTLSLALHIRVYYIILYILYYTLYI